MSQLVHGTVKKFGQCTKVLSINCFGSRFGGSDEEVLNRFDEHGVDT
jgi:hypothetical protein